jgi:hypothetical protein
MSRISQCRDFREIGSIVHSLSSNVVVIFNYGGVLKTSIWSPPAPELIRDARSFFLKLVKNCEILRKELEKLTGEYQNPKALSDLAEITQDLIKIFRTSTTTNQELLEIHQRLANLANNQVILADESIPEVLRDLNESNIPFFCLTTSYDACSLVRLEEFHKLKIAQFFSKPFLLPGKSTPESPYFLRTDFNIVFTSRVVPRKIPEGTPENAPRRFCRENPISPLVLSSNPELYYSYFCNNYRSLSKRNTLRQLIADGVIPQKPKFLIFIDDDWENVETFRNACMLLKINFWGIHFIGSENLIF